MAYNTSYLSSPDTPSTVFPERLIRPLPKKTIKSRLSQEAAEAIQYPPTLPSTSLPPYSHYGENGEYPNDSKLVAHQHSDGYDHDHDPDHDEDHDCPHHHHHHHHHHCHHDEYEDDLDSQDGRIDPAGQYYVSSPRTPRSGRNRYSARGSTSGPDGYEAFENTNNKKKRKIPTSGSLSLHHSAMTDQLVEFRITATKVGSGDDGYLTGFQSSTTGLGVQGAGRGRGARKVSGRNPLGVSVNGSNARSGPSKYDQNMTANAKGKTARSTKAVTETDRTKAEESKDQGIISAAIANATALLRKPLSKGQENTGVLDQEAKQTYSNSQFTFTCETDSRPITFPEQSGYPPNLVHTMTRFTPMPKGSAQANQTTPNTAAPAAPQASTTPAVPNANVQGKKPRRRKGDVYALAARQRKLQQEYNNLQHPPAPEDIWICEFCEYESIFGQPPHALIRQYEIKDRKERRRLAEKRRLLEKAKLKGRKGKKQTKNAAKAANHNAGNVNQQSYDNQPLDQLGDDDLDYGYDDDPIPMPAPPAAKTQNKTATGALNATTDKAGGTAGSGGTR